MKRILFSISLICSIYNVYAQHYGGLNLTPYAIENYSGWRSNSIIYTRVFGPNSTFGFAAGYQGLIMPERRFPFSNGLLLTDGYNEVTYQKPEVYQNAVSHRQDMKSLQMPLWWRHNILKKGSASLLLEDCEINYTPFDLPDFGFGLNYKT